ncbi:MAG: GDP-mannose 4,6-dehydratase [Bacteroidales bacterium]|jgi:dTDP-glucose 4,6-dehydratase
MKRILLTGACGFLGAHLVSKILRDTDWEIVILDRLDISGNLNRIHMLPEYESEKTRLTFVWHDLKAPINEMNAREIGQVDYIVHMAASTHVDRSIDDPLPFVMDNVVGTTNLLQFARLTQKNLKLFLNFSTDEVFGPAAPGVYHKEGDPHNPTNPYSAAKSGQEKIGYAFFKTHNLPVINTHTMNVYGFFQLGEKFIPKCISKVLKQQPMPMYATTDDKGNVTQISSRVWIYAPHVAEAVMFLLEKATPGEEYNIIGNDEYDILTLANKIAKIVNKPLIPEFLGFYNARPGHDLAYRLSGKKIKDMGWTPSSDIDTALKETVEWYLAHPNWLI